MLSLLRPPGDLVGRLDLRKGADDSAGRESSLCHETLSKSPWSSIAQVQCPQAAVIRGGAGGWGSEAKSGKECGIDR